MRLRDLLEGHKKSDRRNIRQQLHYAHRTDTSTQFKPGVPWARVVGQHFYDLHTPQDQRRRVMRALQALERSKGRPYMDALPAADYKIIIKELIAKFDAQASTPAAQLRPGISGVYHLDTAPRVKVDAAMQARMNMVDMDVPNLTKDDLHGHEQEDVRKIGRALSDRKDYHLRDKAVVYDLNGRPWYMFIRPYKRFPGSEPSATGITKYVAYTPQGMNFKSIGISDGAMDTFHKGQKFEPEMRSTEARVALGSTTTRNFQDAIRELQGKAWAASKGWFGAYRRWQDNLLQIEVLEKKGEQHRGLSHEDSAELQVLHNKEQILHNVLRGLPPGLRSPDPQLNASLQKMSSTSRAAFTWYAWLLVAEDEYGVRLPERQRLFPTYPKEPRKTKGRKHEWAIQPERKESGKFRWDTTVFKGLGYSQNEWAKFIEHLRSSSYRLLKSDDEIKRLWLPLVGSIRKKHGLGLHPQDISDYLSSAHSSGKVLAQAEKVAGRVSHKLTVRKTMNAPMYVFKGGNQRRSFALIPAAGYLQYFDSPFHGGERLIHGRHDFEQPKGSSFSAQKFSAHTTIWDKKTKRGAQSWRDKKAAQGYAPKNQEHDIDYAHLKYRRARADVRAAEKIVKLRNEKFQKEKERLKRRAARDRATHTRNVTPSGTNVYPPKGMSNKRKVGGEAGYEFHPIPTRVRFNTLGKRFSASQLRAWPQEKKRLAALAHSSGVIPSEDKFKTRRVRSRTLRR